MLATRALSWLNTAGATGFAVSVVGAIGGPQDGPATALAAISCPAANAATTMAIATIAIATAATPTAMGTDARVASVADAIGGRIPIVNAGALADTSSQTGTAAGIDFSLG